MDPAERSKMDPSLILPLLIVVLAVPMFLQARKQKRTMREQQQLQNSLSTGDRVMTTSGLFGTVVDTAEDTIDLEIAPGVVTTWVRAAVREKVNPDSTESDSASDDESDPAGLPEDTDDVTAGTDKVAKAEKSEADQDSQAEVAAERVEETKAN